MVNTGGILVCSASILIGVYVVVTKKIRFRSHYLPTVVEIRGIQAVLMGLFIIVVGAMLIWSILLQ